MQTPERDHEGRAIPYNSVDILNSDRLIRGITANHIRNGRVSSSLYKSSSRARDPYRGWSVDLYKLAKTRDYSSGKYLGAVQFQASVPRDLGLSVGFDPVVGNGAHSQLWNVPDHGPLKNSQSRQLRQNAEWYASIPDVEL